MDTAPLASPAIIRMLTYAANTAANARTKVDLGNYLWKSVLIEIIPLSVTTTDNLIFWLAVDPESDAQADIMLDVPSVVPVNGTISEQRYPLTVKKLREGGFLVEPNTPIATLYFKNNAALGATESYMIVMTGDCVEVAPL